MGGSLYKTIAGTAPRVAGAQLQRGVQQISDSARASAAGAGGNNAALANYGAIQAAGAAQAKANADATLLRAKEVQDAQMAKASLLNQMQGATGQQTGQSVQGGTSLSGLETQGAGAVAKANAEETAAERNLLGNVVSAGGSYLTAKSDEDAKTDKAPIAANDMEDFLKHIAGFSFKYKDGGTSPGEGPGKRVGVMAQDVRAGGPVGRAVSDGKSLDMRNAVGALLAAVAHVNEKIDGRAA